LKHLCRQFLDVAAASPGAIAVEHGGVQARYADIARKAGRLARFLGDKGLKVGDRVALVVENSPEYVAAMYGCWIAGLVAVPVNAQGRAREILSALEHSGASALIGDANNRQLRTLLDRLAVPVILIGRGRATVPDTCWNWAELEQCDPLGVDGDFCEPENANALILYTSGTTGDPKGILLTHENLAHNVRGIIQYLELSAADRVLAVLPFHYSYGNSVLHTHLSVGATVVIGPSMTYPQQVTDSLRRQRITGFSGVPATFSMLLKRTDWGRSAPDLRYITQAGGAMGTDLTRQLLATLGPETRLFIMYGQTEATARLTWLPPERLLEKLGSAGIPVPGVSLRIVDELGDDVGCGRLGEVVASGGNIMSGYWRNPEATSRVLRDGWLHTGDQGYLDADGYLFLKGRRSEMIKSGAHRINPEEVEEVVAEVSGASEVAVCGEPDELLGQVVAVYIVGRKSADLESRIMHYCREQLALHKVPRAIHWVPRLPRTASGKIKRFELTKQTAGESI